MIQGSDEWHEARLGKVTASNINNVMMDKSKAGYQNYKSQLICERLTGRKTETFKSAAMEQGNEIEGQARAVYTLTTGLDVLEAGFIPHPKITMSGASPDGLVGDDGGVEIKCPEPTKHIKNLTGGTLDRLYRLQIQWNMACTGREWWDYVSFNSDFPDHMRLHVRRIHADPELIEEITMKVIAFLGDVEETIHRLEKGEAA